MIQRRAYHTDGLVRMTGECLYPVRYAFFALGVSKERSLYALRSTGGPGRVDKVLAQWRFGQIDIFCEGIAERDVLAGSATIRADLDYATFEIRIVRAPRKQNFCLAVACDVRQFRRSQPGTDRRVI